MKINYLLVVILIAFSLIFVSGQQGCSQEQETEFDSSGLAMAFVADAPPVQVNYGQTFPIYVDINNNGGYDVDIARANFYLSGIGENLKNVETTLSNSVKLTKKTTTVAGGSERLEFATVAEPAVPLQNPYTLNMQLDSCYDYLTLSQVTLCVGDGKSICTISDDKMKTGTNTAGPIQVTSVTERTEGNKIYYDITIENKGTGKVYLNDADCEKLQIDDINEKQKQDSVNIALRTTESTKGFLCSLQQATKPYATINAVEGSAKIGKITCVQTIAKTNYPSPLEIILSYKYRETKTQALTILPA